MNAADQVRLLRCVNASLRVARSAAAQLPLSRELLEPLIDAADVADQWLEQQQREVGTDWEPVCFGVALPRDRVVDLRAEVV